MQETVSCHIQAAMAKQVRRNGCVCFLFAHFLVDADFSLPQARRGTLSAATCIISLLQLHKS